MVASISPQQLSELKQSGQQLELIDVRTPAEYREVHVPFARNIPLDKLQPEQIQAGEHPSPLYVICRSGSRGQQACQKLISAGMDQVVNVEGGTLAWDQAGLPVERGKKTIPLDGQVRLVLGIIVLTGCILGYLIHPGWFGLAAFIGAGLIFSGITGFCGMAILISKMPWNQVRETTCST